MIMTDGENESHTLCAMVDIYLATLQPILHSFPIIKILMSRYILSAIYTGVLHVDRWSLCF